MAQFVYGDLPKDLEAVAIIMAGGSGTRFWPLSRKALPKQYLPLADESKSLIQATASRLEPLVGPRGILVVTSESQVKLVQEQLPQACILAEPSARNTAACVGVASKFVLDKVGDVPTLCLPADHVIQNEIEIREVYTQALKLCRNEDALVTIGIKPNRPETGYGYVQAGELFSSSYEGVMQVKQFVEKPDLTTAQGYLDQGDYFWNSGMFAWRPSVILNQIKELLPEMSVALDEIGPLAESADSFDEIAKIYNGIESVSIDVGILERAESVVMYPGDSFDWSDVGSWHSWAESVEAEEADKAGNIIRGEVLGLDVKNSALISSGRLLAVVGLENVVVVDTGDAVLVCHRDKAQQVKDIVETLKADGREKYL
jgi:mannose-1-phosphate guanylyltransferase